MFIMFRGMLITSHFSFSRKKWSLWVHHQWHTAQGGIALQRTTHGSSCWEGQALGQPTTHFKNKPSLDKFFETSAMQNVM